MGSYLNVRWMFGLLCRHTNLAIIYSIGNKRMETLSEILKAHVDPGQMIFSDSHMSYVKGGNASHLAKHGWYHFWTNHSIRMIHEKFPFNHTLNIEHTWSQIKRHCYNIKTCHRTEVIQEWCDVFLVKKKLCKKERLHEFVLRCIHDYYATMCKRFAQKTKMNYEDSPSIDNIDYCYRVIDTLRKHPTG